MSHADNEYFVSVDVETSGPIPEMYSLLSIGACLVDDTSVNFSCLVKPVSEKVDPNAMEVTGLSLSTLQKEGLDPVDAMNALQDWLARTRPGLTPIFVGLNAGFDWSFINYYFHRYTGANPFGFAPLDIKALFMGATGSSWRDSRSSVMSKVLGAKLKGNHDALHDAQAQAELFRLTLEYQLGSRLNA